MTAGTSFALTEYGAQPRVGEGVAQLRLGGVEGRDRRDVERACRSAGAAAPQRVAGSPAQSGTTSPITVVIALIRTAATIALISTSTLSPLFGKPRDRERDVEVGVRDEGDQEQEQAVHDEPEQAERHRVDREREDASAIGLIRPFTRPTSTARITSCGTWSSRVRELHGGQHVGDDHDRDRGDREGR